MSATEKTPRAGRPKGIPDHNQCKQLTNSEKPRKAAPFDSIADTIAGQQEGSRFVRDLCDGVSAPDALCMRLREIAGNASKMRGFCRALQKFIERGRQ